MRRKPILTSITILIVAAIIAWGPIVSSNVEKANYTVAEKHDNIEIRDYAQMIVAEAEVNGEREEAINQGFRIIADYIFGNNVAAQKVAMTAPVTQQGADGNWKIRFVMPSSYTLATLPKPKNDAVRLHEIEGKRFAVIRFSGMAGKDSLKKHADALNAFLKDNKRNALSQATYAFFNPPWTLPFLRRNEVMIEIAK